jgi:hypothetical protein
MRDADTVTGKSCRRGVLLTSYGHARQDRGRHKDPNSNTRYIAIQLNQPPHLHPLL